MMRVDLMDLSAPEKSCSWHVPQTDAVMHAVSEESTYQFILSEGIAGGYHEIFIGDERLEITYRFISGMLEFEKGVYFESASGKTPVSIYHIGDDKKRVEIFHAELLVKPSKMGIRNYQCMVRDLQCVCRALVMDVRGKSYGQIRSPDRTDDSENVPIEMTYEEEIAELKDVCRRLSPILREIRLSPKSAMSLRETYIDTTRCASPRMVRGMMKRGIAPTRAMTPRKFRMDCPADSADIAEHRLLKAFLKLIYHRLLNCRQELDAEIARLEFEKQYRIRPNRPDEKSLYELEDLPRIMQLRKIGEMADTTLVWLQAERRDEFWRGVGEEVFVPECMQFAENDYYLAAVNLVLRYLRGDTHWHAALKMNTRLKKSSRMYEQWVLVQLVAAFSACGVPMPTWDDVISRGLHRRFVFDLAANTTFAAPFAEGYEIRIRYTPRILPRDKAEIKAGETLCMPIGTQTNWNPDIVIELCHWDGSVWHTRYAVVLDAKYSCRPSIEMKDSVKKYEKIRTASGKHGRRIVRQTWLVYPEPLHKRGMFSIDDEGMIFSPQHGVTYSDDKVPILSAEQVNGRLRSLPGAREDESVAVSSIGIRPKREFLIFARGTIAYFHNIIGELGIRGRK